MKSKHLRVIHEEVLIVRDLSVFSLAGFLEVIFLWLFFIVIFICCCYPCVCFASRRREIFLWCSSHVVSFSMSKSLLFLLALTLVLMCLSWHFCFTFLRVRADFFLFMKSYPPSSLTARFKPSLFWERESQSFHSFLSSIFFVSVAARLPIVRVDFNCCRHLHQVSYHGNLIPTSGKLCMQLSWYLCKMHI